MEIALYLIISNSNSRILYFYINYLDTQVGGLELMDLRVEQAAIQWETTRGHLRRLDRAGKGVHITAHDTQVEAGSSIPFYDIDPQVCNYVTAQTRWRYLWEMTFELGLKINMYQQWRPTAAYDNDSNIMDMAMKDNTLTQSKWPMLQHVNQCRLYMRSFFISDLTRDGVNIYLPYLEGNERRENNMVQVPDVRRPTGNQWKIWKSFIYRNFLSPGTKINPTLGEKKPRKDHRDSQLVKHNFYYNYQWKICASETYSLRYQKIYRPWWGRLRYQKTKG